MSYSYGLKKSTNLSEFQKWSIPGHSGKEQEEILAAVNTQNLSES